MTPLEQCVAALREVEFAGRDIDGRWICPSCERYGDGRYNPGVTHAEDCTIALAAAAAETAPSESDERSAIVAWLRSLENSLLPCAAQRESLINAIVRGEHRRRDENEA